MKYLVWLMAAVIFPRVYALSPLPQGPADCGDDEFWESPMGMCSPLKRPGSPATQMMMVHANGFLADVWTQGPRGQTHLAAPHFVMFDMGQSSGENHYLNVDLMLTAEKWTYPSGGYPELLQMGEGYVDAQHPHSSPVMGLTISDTISLSTNKDYLKVFFAPRGQSTDGPVAFMHRPTAMVNPNAPLGHHLQDVGHISSTVMGGALHLGDHTLEASVFKGLEPDPRKIDLPMARPDSLAIRWTGQWSSNFATMLSTAKLDHIFRTSASLYNRWPLGGQQKLLHTLIYGLINNYDQTNTLSSFTDEIVWEGQQWSLWSRLEVLQRTPQELEIAANLMPSWVTAATLGATGELARWHDWNMALGASLTEDFLPRGFEGAYGGLQPWSCQVFLQVSGMAMTMQ